jgi:hypothetical protein
MVEPITLGALVAGALGAAAGALAKSALGAAGKDAYGALKDAVISATGESQEIAKLEVKPEAPVRVAALAQTIDESPAASSAQLKALAEALTKVLECEGRREGVQKYINVMADRYGTAAGHDVNINFGTFFK